MYHEEGGPALGVTVHLLPGCGLEGQVFDIHILIDDTMFHEQVYQTPMEICNKYVYIYELPPGVDFIEGGNLYMEGFEGGYPSTVWVELTCRAHSVLKKIKVPYRE
jgi:hypothetical protein